MKKSTRRTTDIFSLSFLDIIACGFGAIVLLLLIVKTSSGPSEQDSKNSLFLLISELLATQENLIERKEAIENIVTNGLNDISKIKEVQNTQQKILEEYKKELSVVSEINRKMEVASQSLTQEMKDIIKNNDRDEEVGGIPVDSEYIIFIIDNSGSMRMAWPRVVKEISNILDIYPTIKGIQIMNDQGAYLIKGYGGKGKWIPDNSSSRKNVLDMIKTQSNLGMSYSNPTNGIKTALRNHFVEGKKISIYLLGDDINTPNVQSTIDQISSLNKTSNGNKKARIHGMVFATIGHARLISYSNFVRNISLLNEGTSLYIPIAGHPGWYDAEPGHIFDTD